MLYNIPENHVKFISYNAPEYSLCTGTLKLEIDGVEYEFQYAYTGPRDGKHFSEFWRSGGGFDKDYRPYKNEWLIDLQRLPEQFQKYAAEIDRVFNDNVRYGCCGGCD